MAPDGFQTMTPSWLQEQRPPSSCCSTRAFITTARPQRLLKNDGTIVRQVVESVRPAQPELAAASSSLAQGSLFLTLRSFLSAYAIRAKDSMADVDWCSTNNSVPCAIQAISVPLLITAMSANSYFRFNELHYELAKSTDKDFIIIEGAIHSQMPCVRCEVTPDSTQTLPGTSSTTLQRGSTSGSDGRGTHG